MTSATYPKFDSSVPPPETQNQPAWWFIFQAHRLLVHVDGDETAVPWIPTPSKVGITPLGDLYLGSFDGRHCYAAEVPEGVEPPEGMRFLGLRRLFGLLDDDLLQVAGRAIQLVDWERHHQYCGRCATPTETDRDWAKVCPNCGLRAYPRLSPAIIVAIQRDDKLLLARTTRHPQGFHSVLAGFVEPGETLEETVAREIYEEVGILVKNIRYFGSQPWPFPNSLMIGFTCEHAEREITLRDEEIAHADWYTAAEVRKLTTPPASVSISGRLIEWFIVRHA